MYLGVSNNNLASTTLCFLHEAVQKFGFPLSSNVPLAITAFVSNKQNRGLNCCDAKIILYKSVRFVNIICCRIICNICFARVRGHHGGENVDVACFMFSVRGTGRCSFIAAKRAYFTCRNECYEVGSLTE